MSTGKILCAMDFSHKACGQIAACAARLTACTGAEAILLYVAPSLIQQYAEGELPHDYFQKADAIHVNRAEKAMEDLVKTYFPRGNVRTMIREGEAANVILEAARAEDVEMIVIGAHGRHWSDLLLGSVAHKILKNAPMPVLSIHPCPTE